MNLNSLFGIIQKKALPGIWSKGVSLSRTNSVIEDSRKADEISLRVLGPDHPVSRRVSLWPDDEDWHCDCGGRVDVCAHVVAAVIVLKSGQVSKPLQAQIQYRFTRKNHYLLFERWIFEGKEKKRKLTESLVSFVGGVNSGRISCLPVTATQDDFSVDPILNPLDGSVPTDPGNPGTTQPGAGTWLPLFKILVRCLPNVQNDPKTNGHVPAVLDDVPVSISSSPLQMECSVSQERGGFRLKIVRPSQMTEAFKNGVALCDGVLRAVEVPNLNQQERQWLAGENGSFYPLSETAKLVSEILPVLEKKIRILKPQNGLPTLKHIPPKIVLELDVSRSSNNIDPVLRIIPRISYATNEDSQEKRNWVVPADPQAEQLLVRKLQNELQLTPGHSTQLEGDAAVDFCLRVQNSDTPWEISGPGAQIFELKHRLGEKLEPQVHFSESGNDLSLTFQLPGFAGATADPAKVFQAWTQNVNYVPLLQGGWAALPQDWLDRYGSRLLSFLSGSNAAKQITLESKNQIPSHCIPDLVDLCQEMGQSCPNPLQNFRNLLEQVDQIEPAILPSDLNAKLRHYQEVGVNWLQFLRKAGIGALLADDMGLGKTLQALCAIQGKTLVVTPTSVLQSWADQIRKFRPSLSLTIYHGTNRSTGFENIDVDVVVTSYGILRLDSPILASKKWGTIILDEAQMIKNPENQISKIAHSLQAEFKIALTGTPVENRLDDLWSQFQFLNPGLLGTRETFLNSYSNQTARAKTSSTQMLRTRVKPFILRRLKKDVAPELPPKIEKTLSCQLSPQEREVYQTILASARTEVLEKLEAGASVMAALEILLRLRQACCHPLLVPGMNQDFPNPFLSAKIEVLMDTLESSLELGHKALIFSQWTSFLDLIEPHLEKKKIRYSRLDGSTTRRGEVIENFQNPQSAETEDQVMLISLKAGGVGLTLTAADHVYLMDPWWNPAVENQAIDRVYRIGQTNTVIVHRLVAEDSIEERILTLQKAKSDLAKSVLEDDEPGYLQGITRSDILALLAE